MPGSQDLLFKRRLTSLQEKIRRTLDGIPKDLEQTNPHAWKQIGLKVGYEATQLRSAVKKVVSSGALVQHFVAHCASAEGRFNLGPYKTNESQCPHKGCYSASVRERRS